jgi:hypothetical protein
MAVSILNAALTTSSYGRRSLLTLPKEVRSIIYNFVLFDVPDVDAIKPPVVTLIPLQIPEDAYPCSHYHQSDPDRFPSTSTETHTLSYYTVADIRFAFSGEGLEFPPLEPLFGPHNLMSTCRTIRQELRPLYYSSSTFVVYVENEEDLAVFDEWLYCIGKDACSLPRTLMPYHCVWYDNEDKPWHSGWSSCDPTVIEMSPLGGAYVTVSDMLDPGEKFSSLRYCLYHDLQSYDSPTVQFLLSQTGQEEGRRCCCCR